MNSHHVYEKDSMSSDEFIMTSVVVVGTQWGDEKVGKVQIIS